MIGKKKPLLQENELSEKEKRIFDRVETEIPCLIKFPDSTEDWPAKIRDICPSGMGLTPASGFSLDPKPGETVLVTAKEIDLWKLRATVKWVSTTHEGLSMGIEVVPFNFRMVRSALDLKMRILVGKRNRP